MPEYLAPGVYVEETSFRAKSIEGVGTSTTAFVGPTRKGPFRTGEAARETPELLTSYGDFERIYGSYSDLDLGAGVPSTNYLGHAVLAFFNEGGSRLYVSRVVGAGSERASARVSADGAPAAQQISFVARFPGTFANARPGIPGRGEVTVREISSPASPATMAAAPAGTLLLTNAVNGISRHVKVGGAWHPAGTPADPAEDAAALGAAAAAPLIVTLAVTVTDADGSVISFDDMGYDATHPRWVAHVMAATPSRRSDHLQNAFAIAVGAGVTGLALHDALFDGAVANAQGQLERTFQFSGGTDGSAPALADYTLALGEIASLEDVSIVAAPGSQA